MKQGVYLKVAPLLWAWVTKRAKTAGSKIAVVEQAITEMKAREEIHRSKRQDAKREKPE